MIASLVFSDQRLTKSITRSRTSCDTQVAVKVPQDFFQRDVFRHQLRQDLVFGPHLLHQKLDPFLLLLRLAARTFRRLEGGGSVLKRGPAKSPQMTPETGSALSVLFVHLFASSLRLYFAQLPLESTFLMGGWPILPQEHGPCILASVMQEQDIVFMQAHTVAVLPIFACTSRLCFAQSLSAGTAFKGGPPRVPQAHGPSFSDSVMQEQDLVFKQAHTYTVLAFFFVFPAAARAPPCAGIRPSKHTAKIAVVSPRLVLVFISTGLPRLQVGSGSPRGCQRREPAKPKKLALELALVNIHLKRVRDSHYNFPKMKKAPSGISPVISVSKKDSRPLYRQLYEGYRQAIVNGNLRAGQRVPSTRILAEELGISRVPVLSAYTQLLSEGYFESRTGSGTVVSASLPNRGGAPQQKSSPSRTLSPSRRNVSKRCMVLPSAEGFYVRRSVKPFSHSQIAFEHFPLQIWNRLLTRHARGAKGGSLDYGDPMGLRDLREVIATYLRTARGVRCEAQQIVIVSGSQQGLEITTRVLLDAGDRVCMEEPGYNFARSIFASCGCPVAPVRVDGEGLEVATGMRRWTDARAVLVTPSHQYPLGVTMSASRRLQLLDWAERSRAWIIEDDYDSEYRYEGMPITSLQGLDRNGRVVYIGTFSKVLFPSLRLGYVVLPADLVERFLAVRFAMDICPPTFHQMVLADFIREGHFSRHIRRMRSIYGERRSALMGCIRDELGTEADLPGGQAGLHLSVILKGISDREIAARASRQNLSLTPLSPFYAGKAARQGFVLGFGSTPVEEMPAAVRKLRMLLASKS